MAQEHLAMHKMVVNQVMAAVFDGIPRHNPEGDDAPARIADIEARKA